MAASAAKACLTSDTDACMSRRQGAMKWTEVRSSGLQYLNWLEFYPNQVGSLRFILLQRTLCPLHRM
jgi:hypothetical protein